MRAAIMKIRGGVTALLAALLLAACATAPEGTYFARPSDPSTPRMAQILSRTAVAGGDAPARYRLALLPNPAAPASLDAGSGLYLTHPHTRPPPPARAAR